MKLLTANTEFIRATTSLITMNNGQIDMDFKIKGDGVNNLFYINAGQDQGALGTNNPLGMFHIDQSSTTKAEPVLYLDQADISEEFINFAIAGDVDMKLLQLSVTGTPTLDWDESANAFSFSDSLVVNEHYIAGGSAPALTFCGGSPSITGTDTAGRVTIGTGGPTQTVCTITFATAFGSTPVCVASTDNTAVDVAVTSISTTRIITTCTAPCSGTVVSYVCMGLG